MAGGLTFEAKYTFTNDAENGLKHFLEFVNEMYVIEKGDK